MCTSTKLLSLACVTSVWVGLDGKRLVGRWCHFLGNGKQGTETLVYAKPLAEQEN